MDPLQPLADINFNQIWFSLIVTILNIIVVVLLGGDPTSALSSGSSSSLFSGLF